MMIITGMDSSAVHPDNLNLEDLIKCVSIGKSSINQLSGKYDLIETLRTTDGDDENKLKQTSSETDFNPVLHRASVNKVNYICDDVQQSVKHLKRGSNNVSATNSESIEATIEMNPHKQQHAKKLNNCKSTAQACSMQRLKRKRRLFDSDNCSSKINDKTTKVTEQVGTNLIENASCSEPVSSVIEKEDTELTARLSSCSDNQKQSNSDQTDDCENDTVISPERIDCNEKVIPTSNTLPNLQQLSLKENVDGKKQNTSSAVDISSIERLALDNETDPIEDETKLQAIDCAYGEQVAKKRKAESELPEPRSLRKRIRKTLPPPKARQTPMGLPKPLRIKKEKFSLEEIYTNKDYSTPVPKLLETIFEYPKEEKDGSLRFAEKKRKQRAVYFVTDPANRPTKKRNKFKKRSTRRSKRDTDVETDTKLLQTLADLDQHLLKHDLSP